MDVLREKLENHTFIFQLKEDLSLYQRELLWAQVRLHFACTIFVNCAILIDLC